MKIHEYQAKQLLREFGVPVPDGDVADTPGAARAIAERLGGTVVGKAQVHAGGRGKGGGVQPLSRPSPTPRAARAIPGLRVQTPPTPPTRHPRGKVVGRG